MDAVTGAVIILGLNAVGKPAIQVVQEFAKAVLGPLGGAVGTDLAESYRVWQQKRSERAEKMLIEAAEIVARSGQEPKAIPPYLLIPLLEKGSLVTDDDMTAIWAQLLATAATADPENPVRPSFPQILSELTGYEARLAEYLYRRSEQGLEHAFDPDKLDFQFKAAGLIGIGEMLDNLARLRLVEVMPQISGHSVSRAMGTLQRGYDEREAGIPIEPGVEERVYLTAFGGSFMAACRGPQTRAEP